MMWDGMWSFGRRGGNDPERKRYVAADAARKLSTWRYNNQGLEPPTSLFRRETEEYYRRQARLAYDVRSSRTPLSPADQEGGEGAPVTPRGEEGAQGGAVARWRRRAGGLPPPPSLRGEHYRGGDSRMQCVGGGGGGAPAPSG